jgi:hypothetical protein
MNTTTIRKRFVTGAIGAAIVGTGAPALLFIGIGTAQAAATTPDVSQSQATTTTIQTPGHVAIHVEPGTVSAPLVWGAFASPTFIVGD